MSLDNAIAIAAAAKAISPDRIGSSFPFPSSSSRTLISKLLDRFSLAGMVGAALIAWIAGEVDAGDGRRDVVGADGKLSRRSSPARSPPGSTSPAACRACRRHRRRPVRRRARPLLARRKARPHSQG